MKSLRYVVGLAVVGAGLTVVPAVQQAAAGDVPAPAVREPSLVQKVREGAHGSVEVSASRATGKASVASRRGRDGDLYPSSRRPADGQGRRVPAAVRAGVRRAVRASWSATRIKKDRTARHVSYTQRYHGVPVFGAAIRMHIDKHGDLTSVERRARARSRNVDDDPDGRRSPGRGRAPWRWCAPSRRAPATANRSHARSQGRLGQARGLPPRPDPGRRQGPHRAGLPGRGEQPEEHPRRPLHLRQRRQGRQPLLPDRQRARPGPLRGQGAAQRHTSSIKKVWEEGDTFPGHGGQALNADQQNMVDCRPARRTGSSATRSAVTPGTAPAPRWSRSTTTRASSAPTPTGTA